MRPKPGDIVAIRGDKRLRMDGKSMYLPEQLIVGKYLRHTGRKGIWLGVVKAVYDDGPDYWVVLKNGGSWRGHLIEVMVQRETSQ